jgi:hypothetical protein
MKLGKTTNYGSKKDQGLNLQGSIIKIKIKQEGKK